MARLRRRARRHAADAVPSDRRLRLEPLEDRRLLANVTVGNLNDVVSGNVTSIAALIASDGGDGISLREAVLAANADAAADVIDFAPSVAGAIQLTNVGHAGEILINNHLTINGPGAGVLTIRAFAGTGAAGDGARIFNISDGAATVKDVSISGLTLTGGDLGTSAGGAIRSYLENLTLTGCTISGNQATNGNGGGVWQVYGSLTINACTISGNTASRGGGIYSFHGAVSVTDSTISGNTATTTPNNQGGGGISSRGSLTLNNSTISGNSANNRGGGIYHYSGSLTIGHSTITGNRSDADENLAGVGGGVYVRNVGATATIDHTIVAGNVRSFSERDDLFGPVTARYSLLGNNQGATITDDGGNQIGMGVAIDPVLGPLLSNGGPTLTHALLAGSPAIDAGDASFVPPPDFDQRGVTFVRVFDGDHSGGARIDIGAYERQTLAGSSFVVDLLADEYDSNYSAGNLSMREAIDLANGNASADTISFDAALTSGGPATMLLTMGELLIQDSMSIQGPGAGLLTIDASGSDTSPASGDGARVFRIYDALGGATVDIEIAGLTLTGGDPTDFFSAVEEQFTTSRHSRSSGAPSAAMSQPAGAAASAMTAISQFATARSAITVPRTEVAFPTLDPYRLAAAPSAGTTSTRPSAMAAAASSTMAL